MTQGRSVGESTLKVLITGAGNGLGAAIARRFAAAGYTVGVTDIDQSRADEMLAELRSSGAQGFSQKLDITRESDWAAIQQRVEQEWDGLDVLINNAGVAAAGRCEESSLADWEWIIAVDLMGVVRGCHRFLPLFRRQAGQGRGAHIINMSSFAGLAAMPGLCAYGTAKAGVVALSEHLLTELADTGIGVSVVCPSFVKTGLLRDFRSPDPSHRELVDRWMDKSGVTAAEVADQVFTAMLQKKFLVLTHAQTRWAWLLKRFRPAYYYRQMARRFGMARRKAA